MIKLISAWEISQHKKKLFLHTGRDLFSFSISSCIRISLSTFLFSPGHWVSINLCPCIFPRFFQESSVAKVWQIMFMLLQTPCVAVPHQRVVKNGQTHCQSCQRAKNTCEKKLLFFLQIIHINDKNCMVYWLTVCHLHTEVLVSLRTYSWMCKWCYVQLRVA